jgi:flagellin-specific chaperone FliS
VPAMTITPLDAAVQSLRNMRMMQDAAVSRVVRAMSLVEKEKAQERVEAIEECMDALTSELKAVKL